jgi:replicative DNA helicase
MIEFHNIEAERMTLGAILKAPEVMDEVMTILNEQDFYFQNHAKLYGIASYLHEKNRLDFQTLKQWAKEKNEIADIGGLDYIAQLKFSVPTLGLVKYYANQIREQAIKRRGMELSQEIERMTTSEQYADIEQYVAAVNSSFNLLDNGKKGNIVHIKDALKPHMELKKQEVKKSPFMGFGDIDKWMKGLGRDRLIIVAGRPGTGKTALAAKVSRKVAEQDFGPVPFFSIEMGKEELIDRMLSDISAVPYNQIRDNQFAIGEAERVEKANEILGETKLYIDDSPRVDMPYISAQCRKLKREHGKLGLIVIDYLGFITTNQRKEENKNDAIGRVTKECKMLARELGCSVLLLCQMNREVEKRSTKRPVLSDLRDSGNIEQDADMVIFLYKDEDKSNVQYSHINFIVAKGRQTGVADFELSFIGDIQRMTGMQR